MAVLDATWTLANPLGRSLILSASERKRSNMVRSEILEGIEALHREGMLVKALDESGEPLLRKGQQVYKAIDGATSAERAFWNKENKVS
jgi:hypothetical protein